ncbi:enoyl-CoA hydratase/isomerase family protein [Chloroflexota bacterium]
MPLEYEKKNKIAYITLNRPEARNAMDFEMYEQLSKAWIDVRDDPDVWVAIITGAGDKAFSAGRDLKTSVEQPELWHIWQTQEDMILNRGLEVWKPVIAAVNGYCLAGGMTLLLATDIRIAAEHASFGLAEVTRGLLPGNGGTQRAIQQLPYPIAMYLLLTGDRMSAQDAYRYGLVNKVVPLDELMTEAEKVAERICENGPLAVRATKELAVKGQYLPIEYGLRLEAAMRQILFSSEDGKEGPRAFAEKRKPVWRGK